MTVDIMQKVLSNSGELRLGRYRMQVAWGGYSSDQDIWLGNYYLYKSIYHLHYSDCASYKSTSSLDEQAVLSLVSLLSRSPSPPISPSGFMCIIMLSGTYGTTFSLSKYSFWIFSTCFQYPCWSSYVTSHSKPLVTSSNFWKCVPTVLFSFTSLFNLGSCELYRFRSYIWRQSNCMTMISQYAINFVDISLGFCGRIKSFLLMVSSDTIPFLHSHTMHVFTMQVACRPGVIDRENYLEQLLAEVES